MKLQTSCRPFLVSSRTRMSCRGCILDAAGYHQPYPTYKTWILHLLTHDLTFLEFDAEMAFLTDSEKLL